MANDTPQDNVPVPPPPVPPPYRIETERTVMRCPEPGDAKLMQDAIKASLENLRQWMPWAGFEPESVADKAQRLRGFRGKFDLDENYMYVIFTPDESKIIGGTGLHPRVGPNAYEIGYWIHSDHVNQGIATEIAGALVKVAFEICEVDRVEIHCDPRNLASARVPEKLNFTHEATLKRRLNDTEGAPRDEMIWTIFADCFDNSPSKQAAIKAFDVLGNIIL